MKDIETEFLTTPHRPAQCRYAGRDVFGHQGSMLGYVTVMVHHRPSALTLALTTNTGSGNRLSFYAAGLHGVVDTILGRVLGWIG